MLRRLRLDPARASTLGNRALYMNWMGRPAEALPLTAKAIEINPADRSFELRVACRAYLQLGRYDDAIAACEKSAAEDEYWTMHVYLVAAYGQKGETAKAATAKVEALKRQPKLTIKWYKDFLLQVSDNAIFQQQDETHLLCRPAQGRCPGRVEVCGSNRDEERFARLRQKRRRMPTVAAQQTS